MEPSITHSNKSLDTLNHVLRSKLYDLIKIHPHTTIELSKKLKENRVNLYHHLQMLEKVGLITSHYNKDRMKCYRMPSNIQITPIDSISAQSKNASQYKMIILSPTTQNSIEFKETLQDLVALSGGLNLEGKEILQLQILYQTSSE